MAEAELTLSYRELPVTCFHWILLLSVPVVSLFVLLCSICVWTLANADISNISIFIFSLFSLMILLLFGLVITSDKTIFLTRDGISLPFVVCPKFGLRSQHNWSELSSVRLLPWGKQGNLVLSFKDGSCAKLKLDLLSEAEVENLIVSMDVWAGGQDTFPALLEARVRLKEKTGELKMPGYTDIWEEELSRRFGPTNFIPLEPGQEVGAFTVERQLAFGGLSAIYLVADKRKQRFVLKEAVVPPDANESMRQFAERMLDREANILSSLSHPNIARVLDNFLESGRHYILMEFIDGVDLRRLVKEHGPQSESAVISWSLTLLEILQYLHSQQPPVIHRDLSPDNLMLSETGHLRVIDFAAANHFVGTATGTLIGKQAYIPPEQLRGQAEPRSDIYSFGCILFFLLTGKDSEPLSVSHPRELNPAVSPALDNIIASCTEQEAEDRPESALALSIRMKQLEKSEPRA